MVTLLIKGNYHGNIIASQPIKIKDSMKFIIDIRVAINGKFYAIVPFYHQGGASGIWHFVQLKRVGKNGLKSLFFQGQLKKKILCSHLNCCLPSHFPFLHPSFNCPFFLLSFLLSYSVPFLLSLEEMNGAPTPMNRNS